MSKKSGHQEHPAKIRVRTEEGYKQTEIGVIPSDWETVTIDEIARISTGNKDTQNKIEDGQYPFFVRSQIIERINSFSFDGEAILTSGDGVGVGKIFHYYKGKFDYHQRVYNIHSFLNYNAKFFYYYFSNHFFSRMMQMTAKSSVDSVRREMISDMLIPIPKTLKEQKTIATVLTDTDKLINTLKTLIAKKKAIKQGAMQELLTGKKRLNKFQENWVAKKIADIMGVYRGGSPRPIQMYLTKSADGHNWIKIGDTHKNSKYITSSKEKIIPEGALSSRRVYKGNFLLSNSMSFGRPYILNIDGCVHDGWLVLQDYEANLDKEFLYYLLSSKEVYNQYLSKAAGSGVLNLNKELVKTIELKFPERLAEQKAISKILCDMDLEITTLETQLQKTQNLKQGMMQELLTGKTRLVSPEDDKPFNTLAKVAAPNETYSKTTH